MFYILWIISFVFSVSQVEKVWLINTESIDLWSNYVCVDTNYANKNEQRYTYKLDDVVYVFSQIFKLKVNNEQYRLLRVPFTNPELWRTKEEKAFPKYKVNFQSLSWTLYTDGFCRWDLGVLKDLTKFYSFHNILIPFFSEMKIIEIKDKANIEKIKIKFFPEDFFWDGEKTYLMLKYQGKNYPIILQYIDFLKIPEKKYRFDIERKFSYFYFVDDNLKYTNSLNSFTLYSSWRYLFHMYVWKVGYSSDLSTYFQLMPIKTIIFSS